MKLAFLYAGQGSQQENMGKDLYTKFPTAKNIYDRYPHIRDLSFQADLKTLSQTKNTQPCMILFDIVVTNLLRENGVVPDMVAGLSIGEYASLYASDVLPEKEVLTIAEIRGQAMEDALSGKDTMMCALLGISKETAKELCSKHSIQGALVQIANYNCPGQIVIAGDKLQVKKVIEEVKKERLGRAIALRVSGAFHTDYMKPAAHTLEREFQNMFFSAPKIPIVWNVSGREKTQQEDIPTLLIRQVQSPVHFQDSIEYMLEKGIDTFIEIGFGKVLEGFIKKISDSCSIYSCNTIEDLENIACKFGKRRENE